MSRSRRSATRSVGPQSPPKRIQVASHHPTSQARKLVRSAGRGLGDAQVASSKPISHLAAVKEESVTVTPLGLSTTRDSTADDLDSIPSDTDSSDDDDEDELDTDLIIDSLPDLYQDASKVLSLAELGAFPNSPREVNSGSTALGRRFRQSILRLQTSLEIYRRGDGFVSVEKILRKLMQAPHAPLQSYRPDAILYIANFAILLSDIVLRNEDFKLELLAHTFPGYPDGTNPHLSVAPVDLGTIDLAISLRTQYFVGRLADYDESEDLNLDDLLTQAFYDEDGDLLGFESHDQDTIDIVETACSTRIEKLKSAITKSAVVEDVAAEFPREQFVTELVSWVLKRTNDLNKEIENMGGPNAIVRRLRQQESQSFVPTVTTPKPTTLATSVPQKTAAPSSAIHQVSSVKMNKRMQQFKRLRAKRAAEQEDEQSQDGSTRGSSQEIPQSPVLGDTLFLADGSEPAEELREPSLPPLTQNSVVPSQKTAMILQVARRQAAQSNKENINVVDNGRRFIDRQKSAKRVDWDEEFETVSDKRPHDVAGDEDDDFEHDMRDHKRARFERPRSASQQPRMSDGGDEEEQQAQIDDQLRSEDERYHGNTHPPPSTQPAPSRSPLQARTTSTARLLPSSAPVMRRDTSSSNGRGSAPVASSSQAPELVSREAKMNLRRLQATTYNIQPQVRRGWSAEETLRLLDLVAIHGTAWSRILQEDLDHPDGPELQGRGQVALKDKARNIKMDYLKALQPLPEGFASVSIKSSDIAKLDELQIPHQGGPGGRGA